MKAKSRYRPPVLAAAAAVFLAFQIFGAFHAAAYGDQHHDHNGVACALHIACKAGKDIAPPPSVVTRTPEFSDHPYNGDRTHTVPNQRPYPHFHGRAPPTSFS